jgi:hypothetical protein
MLEYLKDPWLWVVYVALVLIIEFPIVDWFQF